jgi:RNA polymerase sigma-70 factor (ECF subfamily)
MNVETLQLNLLSQWRSGFVGLASIPNKGMNVKGGEEWHDLLFNVASRGCKQSFRKIFNHFFPLLISQGMKRGLSRELAVEISQETLLKVWRKAALFDASQGDLSLWIYIIARNLRYDHFRQSKNDPLLHVDSANVYSHIDSELVDERELADLFELGELSKHVEQLPIEQRLVVSKIYFEGLTHKEVALESKIPLGTVKSRLRLAIKRIKELMEGK